MLWTELRHEEFAPAREASHGVCILPVGCIEKHGQHLPLGTDAFAAAHIARRAAEKEPAVVFPEMYFGEKTGAGEFDGTVMFSSKLRFDILTETCSEIGRNGFKKILILNGHGGNSAMLSNFSRSVLESKKDYMVFVSRGVPLSKRCNAILDANFDYLTDEDKESLRDFIVSKKPVGHGCFVETATAYGLYPHLVRLDKMTEEDGHSNHRFDEFAAHGLETPFLWMANYPNSYTGEAHPINERIARAMVDVEVAAVAKTIKFLKEETISNEYHKEWCAKQQ